jgi:hypothetical protein
MHKVFEHRIKQSSGNKISIATTCMLSEERLIAKTTKEQNLERTQEEVHCIYSHEKNSNKGTSDQEIETITHRDRGNKNARK